MIGRLDGFVLIPVDTTAVTPGQIPGHLSMALQDVLNLFGADVGAAQPGAPAVFAWLHAPGVALAAAAFGLALWRLPGRADLVSDLLAVGLMASVASFVASSIPATPFDARELAAALPYGAVLAGRVLGPWLAGDRRRPADCGSGSVPRGRAPRLRPAVAAAAVALAVAGGCQLAALGYDATRPAAVSPEQALAGWLAARHLTTGLGTYTEDNITTLDSAGAVRMLTVSWEPPADGGTAARLYQSSASWYDSRTAYANFVVTGTADGPSDLIPRTEIRALAGPPDRTYRFASFTIMVWNRNLLTRLGAPPSRTPGDIGRS